MRYDFRHLLSSAVLDFIMHRTLCQSSDEMIIKKCLAVDDLTNVQLDAGAHGGCQGNALQVGSL